MAKKLIGLSTSADGHAPIERVNPHVEAAAELLRSLLPVEWQVETHCDAPAAGACIPGVHLEQILLNLGLLAAEAISEAGRLALRTEAMGGGDDSTGPTGTRIMLAVAGPVETRLIPPSDRLKPMDDAGVIQTIVRSMLEEAGGTLRAHRTTSDRRVLEICLPGLAQPITSALAPEEDISVAVRSMVKEWNLLIARPRNQEAAEFEQRFRDMGGTVKSVHDLVSALSCVEESHPYNAIIIERNLLGGQAKGLVEAIVKLNPDAGLVVLCDRLAESAEDFTEDIVLQSPHAAVSALVNAVWRSQELALQRKVAA